MEIPGEFMFHTVPLNVVGIAEEEEEERGRRKYVTVAFGIRDDLKATVSDPANLRLGGRTLASRGVSTALNFTDESGKAAFSQKKFHKLLLSQYGAQRGSAGAALGFVDPTLRPGTPRKLYHATWGLSFLPDPNSLRCKTKR